MAKPALKLVSSAPGRQGRPRPSSQRADAASTKVRDSMRRLADSIHRSTKADIEPGGWRAQGNLLERIDGWHNSITRLGLKLHDKRMHGNFLSDRIFDLEAEDLWRGDDMASRAVETIPDQIERAGWELLVQQDDSSPAGKQKKAKQDWLRSQRGQRWVQDVVAKMTIPSELKPDETRKLILETIRKDLAGDVFPPDSQAEASEDSKEIAEQMAEHAKDLNVLGMVIEALKAERGYGGAALMPIVRDGQKDLSKPLDYTRIKSVDSIDLLTPIELIPYQWYADPVQPLFGQPELYWMQRISIGNIGATMRIPVHHTRLIHFPGIVVSRRQLREHWGWGDSVLVRMAQVLRDFEACWQGSAYILLEFAVSVLKIKGLTESFINGESNLLVQRAQALQEGLSVVRAAIIDAEEEFEKKQVPISGLPEMLDRFCNRLAAAARMPVTILMGQAPAGLNATGASDIRAFYDDIASHRERKLEPKLRKLYKILWSAKEGPTGGTEPDKWSFQFGPLWQPTELERAQARFAQAQADNIYMTAGAVLPEEIAKSRFGGSKYSFETVLDPDIREAHDAQAQQEAEEEAARIQAQTLGVPPAPPAPPIGVDGPRPKKKGKKGGGGTGGAGPKANAQENGQPNPKALTTGTAPGGKGGDQPPKQPKNPVAPVAKDNSPKIPGPKQLGDVPVGIRQGPSSI